MRGSIIRVMLALGLLVTALHLAPPSVGAEEGVQFAREQTMREAKTPAQHARWRLPMTGQPPPRAKAAEARTLAATYRNLAMTGRSAFQIGDHYRQLGPYYERLAVDYAARAAAHRQLAQAMAQTPQ